MTLPVGGLLAVLIVETFTDVLVIVHDVSENKH